MHLQCCLNRVHVCSRERRWVVRLVMKRVNVAIEKSPEIRDDPLVVFGKPWVHRSVDRVEVRNSPVGDSNRPQKVADWRVHHILLELDFSGCPQMAHSNFDEGSKNRSDC